MKPVSLRQQEILVEFMARHRDLAKGRVRSKEGRALSARLWKELADILNCEAMDPSAYRSAKDWNKFYNDYKCRIKNKSRRIVQSQRQTGGGPSDAPPLSEVEERLCAIIGPDRFEPLPVQQGSVPVSIDNSNVLISELLTEAGQAEQSNTEGEDFKLVTQIENVEEHIPQGPLIEIVQDELLDPLTTRQKNRRAKAKVTPATATAENEVDKSKAIKADIARAQIEVSRSQVQAQLARNEIEQRKVAAINNLGEAAWALVGLFKMKEEKKTRKRARISRSSEDED